MFCSLLGIFDFSGGISCTVRGDDAMAPRVEGRRRKSVRKKVPDEVNGILVGGVTGPRREFPRANCLDSSKIGD